MAINLGTLGDGLLYGSAGVDPFPVDIGHSLNKRTIMLRVKPNDVATIPILFSFDSTNGSSSRAFGAFVSNGSSPDAEFNFNISATDTNGTRSFAKTLGSGAEWSEWMDSYHVVVYKLDFAQISSTQGGLDFSNLHCFVDGEEFPIDNPSNAGTRTGALVNRNLNFGRYFGSSSFGGAHTTDFHMWGDALSDEDCLALSASQLDPMNVHAGDGGRQLQFPLRHGDYKDYAMGISPDDVVGVPEAADPYYFPVHAIDYQPSEAEFLALTAVGAGLPSAPTNPSAVAGDEQVTVSWTNAPTATSHNLYWSLSSPVTTGDNKIASVTTPYIHTGRTNGVEYFYAVAGENGTGEGALSSEVSATPAAVPAYTPSPELSEPQVIGSWRIDQMSLDKQNAGLTLREDRGIQDVKVPGAFFNNTVFPNIDVDIIGDPIPNAIGVGLRGLPAFLIDQDAKRFKVLNNPLVSWDGFRTSDNEKFIPDTLDLATAEFTYSAWDGTTDLFADVSCLGENPVDAVEILLTDDLRGANLDSSRLDTTSTGKGFGSTGARLDYIRGHDSRTGAEKVTFSISLYMAEPKKVEAWIQEVAAASVMVNPYVDQAGVWQCKAWRPIVSDDMLEIDELFLKDPKFTWKMSEPVTKAVANYAKDYGRDSVQSYEYESDELLQLRGLTKHAPQTRELPLSDLFSARYWAQTVVAQRGVPRRIINCRVPQEFSLLELGDFARVIYAPLQIDGPYEVFKSSQQADSMEVDLQLIDVRGFTDAIESSTNGFYMDDVAPDWDNSRTDAEIKNDRENGAWYTDDGGYADTDDPKRSYEEAVYI